MIMKKLKKNMIGKIIIVSIINYISRVIRELKPNYNQTFIKINDK